MAPSKVSLAAVLAVAISLAMAATTTTSAQNTPQDYVNLHNSARRADGVGPVSWDPKVASFAQSYAAKRAGDCRLQHSGGPYGENIFWGSAGRAWSAADAVASWVCGHYTQVVWRKSVRIGCARVVCAANRGVFITCNYDPPGNFNGERPFLTLDAAAK
ncbi:hypothetical protein OsJ_30952 [Oryza sativa Japonica Group]|uniref:SCP domain-containing protein n=1 Tax=Oryza sativa subsp. japonica TaxID=39947 RepID=B9G7V7_ORYSJ|nr:hypothetical protein OsJ_30952 [Oryza sativa Japonica Group]